MLWQLWISLKVSTLFSYPAIAQSWGSCASAIVVSNSELWLMGKFSIFSISTNLWLLRSSVKECEESVEGGRVNLIFMQNKVSKLHLIKLSTQLASKLWHCWLLMVISIFILWSSHSSSFLVLICILHSFRDPFIFQWTNYIYLEDLSRETRERGNEMMMMVARAWEKEIFTFNSPSCFCKYFPLMMTIYREFFPTTDTHRRRRALSETNWVKYSEIFYENEKRRK